MDPRHQGSIQVKKKKGGFAMLQVLSSEKGSIGE